MRVNGSQRQRRMTVSPQASGGLGLGRIVALRHRAPASYQIHERIRLKISVSHSMELPKNGPENSKYIVGGAPAGGARPARVGAREGRAVRVTRGGRAALPRPFCTACSYGS